MEASEAPSYICLFKSTDLSRYSEDELNKINSEFIKDCQKLKGIEFSPYWFGTYMHMIRSKKWREAEEFRKDALDECEKLLQFLVKKGLRSDHQQKQSSTVSVHGQTLLESNALKPQKQKHSQEQISNFQQKKEIVKTNSRTAQTNLVPNSNVNTSKALAKRAILPVHTADSLVLNKHKKSHFNAKTLKTEENKEYLSKAKQIPENAMTTKSSGKTQMAPDSATNVDKITCTKRVQHSNTHQQITQGHVYHKNSGMLDATSSIADESEIMSRRSEEASLLLIQGNPNIADLSDSNRPVKLAERYSELYSNEYTEAFEELTTKQISERDVIQILLNIVTNAYIYCQEKAKDESTQIKTDVQIDFKKQRYMSENAVTIWKAQIAQRLKQSGLRIKDSICQHFIGDELPKILRPPLLPMGNKLSTYASSSVEIVWLMCIQDPPLCMKWTENKNTKKEFDTNLYRFYTKSGKYVDYCVWPVLLLYDEGPLLRKGIAQGK